MLEIHSRAIEPVPSEQKNENGLDAEQIDCLLSWDHKVAPSKSSSGSNVTSKSEEKASNSIGKAFAVLRYFIDRQEEWGVRELAAVVRQPTSSVHRLLKALRKEGYLEFDPKVQRYRIGVEFIRVAAVVAKRTRLGPTALPIMRDLVQLTDETVWLAVYEPDRDRVVYIEEQAPSAIFPIPSPVGREFPAYEDVAGWAVLAAQRPGTDEHGKAKKITRRWPAEIEQARSRGFALQISEGRDPIVRLAVPVFSSEGAPIGALVLALPHYRFKPASEFSLAAALMNAAANLSERLGARILGGASTGSWRDGVQVIAGLLREALPAISTVPSLGGGTQNLLDLQAGRGAYCITTVSSARAAFRGAPPFTQPMAELRNVMSLSRLTLHIIVRKGVACSSIADLAQLRVSPGLSGFSSYQLFQDVMRVAGMPARSSKGQIIELDYAEAARQLVQGNIDCIFVLIVSETSVFKSAVQANGRLLSLDKQFVSKFLEVDPGYERAQIPAEIYAISQKPINTVSVSTLLATTRARKDAEVHKVAETIFENRAELAKVSPSYEDLSFDYASRDIDIPFHPGAEQYWAERRDVKPHVQSRRSKVRSGT